MYENMCVCARTKSPPTHYIEMLYCFSTAEAVSTSQHPDTVGTRHNITLRGACIVSAITRKNRMWEMLHLSCGGLDASAVTWPRPWYTHKPCSPNCQTTRAASIAHPISMTRLGLCCHPHKAVRGSAAGGNRGHGGATKVIYSLPLFEQDGLEVHEGLLDEEESERGERVRGRAVE